jgi:dienelactone hydrolase
MPSPVPSEEPLRPDRVSLRSGPRPHTEFGHDDVDAEAELVVINTADHHHWDGLLMRPRSDDAGRADTLAIIVHGSLGNYMGGVPRRMAFELAHHGYAALSINTRMANFGVAYGGGLFDDTHHDVAAAMDFARGAGFARVVLVGYSLGASIVTHYQALIRPDEVVGLCTLAHPWSLPESMRARWTHLRARPSYTEMARMALRAGVDRDGQDDVVVVMRGAGPTPAPLDAEAWSLKAWWQCRGPESRNPVSVDRIRDVGVPVALIQAGADPILPGDDGENLAAAARAAGVPVHLEHIPAADHTFWGCVPYVAERAVAWMDGLPGAGAGLVPPHRPASGTARLVTIASSDGSLHDAILERHDAPTAARAARTARHVAVVHLHGNQGNMCVGALRFLRQPVAEMGFPILSMDTRIGNVAQMFGTAVLEDVLEDVRAAVGWLAGEGYDHVLLSGYSLGATAAIWCAAQDLGLPVCGAVGFGTAWSLPESSRARMERCGSAPSYEELVELCRPYADVAAEDDMSLVIHRMYLPDDAPRAAGIYTARTWWHSRGPDADAAKAHLHVGRVPAPILLVQGDEDVIVSPGDAARLAEAARRDGHTDVTVRMLAGVGHEFADQDATVAAVRTWLSEIV